jgi:putative zinc finger/helix-turn-helix YgiT family protein
MTQEKPQENMHGETCPFCSKAKLVLQQIEYVYEDPDSPKVSVPGVWVEHCPNCSENIFPAASSKYIEDFLVELDDQLSPRELIRIREDLGVDQGEMSEILGLGDKTYHRWEKGTQFPSRSMGYYIRILANHPETFEWLRERTWRKSNRLRKSSCHRESSPDFIAMFPDLSRTLVVGESTRKLGNPARGLMKVSFILR